MSSSRCDSRRLLGPGSNSTGGSWAFHLLRHTAASWMVQAGVPLYEVQTILGHSSPALTQRYAHLAPGFGSAAVDAIDSTLERVRSTQTSGRG